MRTSILRITRHEMGMNVLHQKLYQNVWKLTAIVAVRTSCKNVRSNAKHARTADQSVRRTPCCLGTVLQGIHALLGRSSYQHCAKSALKHVMFDGYQEPAISDSQTCGMCSPEQEIPTPLRKIARIPSTMFPRRTAPQSTCEEHRNLHYMARGTSHA